MICTNIKLTTFFPQSSMGAATRHFLIGLTIRLVLTFLLPLLLDDGLLLRGVRYTDIDYDVFTDAAEHVAQGRSPYERHTYRYTPFLAALLALPLKNHRGKSWAIVSLVFSGKYFGKILFCIADAICGYIIALLRRRRRSIHAEQQTFTAAEKRMTNLSPDFVDALWWLYNPLPINICTRGSAESLVVLLPVLATVAVSEMSPAKPQTSKRSGNIIAPAINVDNESELRSFADRMVTPFVGTNGILWNLFLLWTVKVNWLEYISMEAPTANICTVNTLGSKIVLYYQFSGR
ncbi:hypothetical protein HJC23_004388 [Cyclotella cryptica]|uniref:GPI mannosyltransferase I n=1 Tax=Cyclotella cryptica TaxID=29204 RepID=A0ABD3PH60_9STRA